MEELNLFTTDYSTIADENLLIGNVVSYADQLFRDYGNCGERCNHPSGGCNDCYSQKERCNNCLKKMLNTDACIGCCLECAEEIHKHRSLRQKAYRNEYNCQKLIYYYVGRYTHKYCSEIMYALETIDLSNYDGLKILSLGCGAAPDLMAFEQINRQYHNRQIHKDISYYGIDVNSLWKPIHNFIKEYSSQNNIKSNFLEKDTFETLEHDFKLDSINVIVMQYFLSSLSERETVIKSKTDTLMELILQNVVSHTSYDKPFLIIINDIDHFRVRNRFDDIIDKMSQTELHYNFQRRHFCNYSRNGRDFADNSTQYGSNSNKFVNLNPYEYNQAILCTSAQLILEVW
jgi:hypothetical protein